MEKKILHIIFLIQNCFNFRSVLIIMEAAMRCCTAVYQDKHILVYVNIIFGNIEIPETIKTL